MPRNSVTGKGGYNAICKVCGFKFKNFEMKMRWDKVITCQDCWETRHPQEFLRVRDDFHPLPWTSPDTEVGTIDEISDGEIFVCSINTRQPKAGIGCAGCAELGYVKPS